MPVVGPKGTLYIGIDPGLSGGLCAIQTWAPGYGSGDDGLYGVDRLEKMPETAAGVWAWFESLALLGYKKYAVIEKVGGYIKPHKGVGGEQPGSSMFKFGMSYGMLLMALEAAGIPYSEVTPQTWQKAILSTSPRKEGATYRAKKGQLKDYAKELYKGLPGITLKTCDALLIAHYCKGHTI